MENQVAKKAIETIDLIKLIEINNIKGFDLKPFLFQDFILKEKDFRLSLESYDFSSLKDYMIYIFCSSDAIVPRWAYMLLSSYFTDASIPHIFAKDKKEAIDRFVESAIQNMDASFYENKRVIIKGCSGKISLSEQIYIKITEKLKPVARAISYGEACSMVPVSKR